MEIAILDVKTLKVVYSYRLKVGENDLGPSDADMFKMAWRCALSDGVVNEDEQNHYLLSSGLKNFVHERREK